MSGEGAPPEQERPVHHSVAGDHRQDRSVATGQLHLLDPQVSVMQDADTVLPTGNAGAIHQCAVCAKPTLRTIADGTPMHSTCEPRHTWSTAPATSYAAGKVQRGRRSLLGQAILESLRREGPATDDELAQRIEGSHPGSVAKRRLDLVRAGDVTEAGSTRPTRFGKQGTVWKAIGG